MHTHTHTHTYRGRERKTLKANNFLFRDLQWKRSAHSQQPVWKHLIWCGRSAGSALAGHPAAICINSFCFVGPPGPRGRVTVSLPVNSSLETRTSSRRETRTRLNTSAKVNIEQIKALRRLQRMATRGSAAAQSKPLAK